MDGSNRPGSYLGQPPQRSGFGRKTTPAPRFTMADAIAPLADVHRAGADLSNDIDFQIGGGDIQFVEIELDPGEAVIAEPGAMIWKDSSVALRACLGDGSDRGTGIIGKIANAGMNALAGESVFLAEFLHDGLIGKARLALGGRTPGHIIPVRLDAMGGTLICHRHGFLAAAKGVTISAAFQKRASSAIFGSEGFVMQRLTGTGWVFLHVGGAIVERELAADEVIHVDGGCVAAHEPQVEMDFEQISVKGFVSTVLAGEMPWMTTLRGPGKVWIQTLPFNRVAAEVAAEAPWVGVGKGTSDGLGLGDVFDGFNAVRKLF